MKRSMGLLASTLLAAGLGIGGTAMTAGPAAADTGLKTVTISAGNYQSCTDNSNRDRDDRKKDRDRCDHRGWCEKHGHWHYYHGDWHWFSGCHDDRDNDRGRRGHH